VIAWDVVTPEGVVPYHITVSQGACSVARGEHPQAGVTLEIGVANFLRLLVGQLDGRDAVVAGTLGISGDRALARTIRDWFRETH
jgi:putative sterol carrier protein